MPKFSILVRLQDATSKDLTQLMENLAAQTEPDWGLVLVASLQRPLDRELAADFTALYERVTSVARPEEELIQWTANVLLPSLGDWVGFMGLKDRLLPTALAELQLAIDSNPDAKIVFTDEEARNQHGHISLRNTKGAINPVRLRTQEYLRDFTAFQRAWLESLGGFNKLASDWPAHDVYLRTLQLRGAAAFVNVPVRLFQRFRNHMHDTADRRRKDHMVGFDLWAMRQYLAVQQIPAGVRQLNGTAEIAYQWPARQAVTLLVTAPEDQRDAIQHFITYVSTFKPYEIFWVDGVGPVELNELVRRCNTPLVCILNALPIAPNWLADLVDHAMLPGAGAIGGRVMSPVQLRLPGTLGYRFDGWDWNTRGRFNELAVPHQVSTVSSACMLIDVQTFLSAGGFNTEFDVLYVMDLCLRLDSIGRSNVMVPDAQVAVGTVPVPQPEEVSEFWAEWPTWTCRFGLHLPE